MSIDRRSLRKSVDSRDTHVTLYFNKNCESGVKLNEHLLPAFIESPTLTASFHSCVEKLLCANTHQLERFGSKLVKAVGNYSEISVKNRLQFRRLLDKLCDVSETCKNFISEEEIDKCPLCDDDDEDEDDEPVLKKMKKVTPNPKFVPEVVMNKKQVRVSVVRMDFSNMATNTEISLPPNPHNDHHNNNRDNAVASKPPKTPNPSQKPVANEAASTPKSNDSIQTPVVIEDASTSPKTPISSKSPVVDKVAPGPSSKSDAVVNVVVANPNQKGKEIALQKAGSTLITIQSNDMPLNALDLLGEGGWSMGDTPPTAPSKPMTRDELIFVLSPSPPNVSNAVEEGVSTLDDASDNSEASTVVNVGAHASGANANGGGTQDDEVEVHSTHSSSDDGEDANEEGLANSADNGSLVYDIQDQNEPLDGISEVDHPNDQNDWTHDHVAEFVLEANASMIEFASFIRNERINGNRVPLISYPLIKDAVQATVGDRIRFLEIIENLKNLFNSTKKNQNSTQSQSATESA